MRGLVFGGVYRSFDGMRRVCLVALEGEMRGSKPNPSVYGKSDWVPDKFRAKSAKFSGMTAA
jgi:hypothetical protein